MLEVSAFVFVDAIKVKSRMFVMVAMIIFVLLNMHDIYNLTFGDWDQGAILLKYAIQENEYTLMKRSTKRSMFIQVMLFSMNGIYTLFKGRKQEPMVFATGNIFRETGTSSKEVEQKTFVRKIESEKRSISENMELESVILRLT